MFWSMQPPEKSGEKGLIQAISALSGNLIFLDDDTINAQERVTPSRATKIGLLGVRFICPCRGKKKIWLSKEVYGRVTVAIAH